MGRGRKRGSFDPLEPVDRMRWLVVSDRLSQPVYYRELPPRTDLRATLAAERDKLIAEGWTADPLSWYSFFFCERGGERWHVAIHAYEPGHVPVGHGSFLGGK